MQPFNYRKWGFRTIDPDIWGAWTPAKATTDGDKLPHTWLYPEAGLYQDSALTTPAVSDGDPVGGWTNQGGDTYNVVQAVLAAKPTLKLNIKNGKPVLRFDGGDTLQGAFNAVLTQPFTIFVVSKLADAVLNDGNQYDLIDSDDATNRMALYRDNSASPGKWAMYFGNTRIGLASNANWNIWTALANGANAQLWINGASQITGNAGVHNPDGITVGGEYTQAARLWAGDISEVLIYNANLSTADKNQVSQYLAKKYAITYTDIT